MAPARVGWGNVCGHGYWPVVLSVPILTRSTKTMPTGRPADRTGRGDRFESFVSLDCFLNIEDRIECIPTGTNTVTGVMCFSHPLFSHRSNHHNQSFISHSAMSMMRNERGNQLGTRILLSQLWPMHYELIHNGI